ncbi:MAG: PQQ-binding-like beta-propeller repeat protein, partial [Hamadaea sp.]|nr:PQQ-binding-like beta-propeller repeat protein [Hamadaea sp.]
MIELGVPEDHEPGPPPAPPWLREWGVRRPLAVLAAAVVCLALLGAAAPARPEVPVRSIGGLSSQDGYQIFGDTLLAFHWGMSSGITAYDLTTGAIRWARSLADSQNPTQEQVDANLAASVVTAYAVDTGEVRWTRRGSLYSAADRKVALIRPPGRPGRLEAVDAVGGTTRWSRPLQPEGSWQLGWRPRNSLYGGYADGLIELAKDGTVTLVDLATGAVTHTAHVPPGGDLSLAWNGVLGVRYGPVTPTGDPGVDRHITFFDLDGGLTQLWTMAIPQSDLSPCSPDQVCSWGPDPTPRRFDLRTGQDITARSAQQ